MQRDSLTPAKTALNSSGKPDLTYSVIRLWHLEMLPCLISAAISKMKGFGVGLVDAGTQGGCMGSAGAVLMNQTRRSAAGGAQLCSLYRPGLFLWLCFAFLAINLAVLIHSEHSQAKKTQDEIKKRPLMERTVKASGKQTQASF